MFTRMPNSYYNYPMWDEVPMDYQYDIMPEDDFEIPPYESREVIPQGTSTGGTNFVAEPGAPVQQDINYTQGWLKTQIGKHVKIEFLIGTTMLIDREGILTEVGISYVVIRESGTNNTVMCDIYSIKFVTVFFNQNRTPQED